MFLSVILQITAYWRFSLFFKSVRYFLISHLDSVVNRSGESVSIVFCARAAAGPVCCACDLDSRCRRVHVYARDWILNLNLGSAGKSQDGSLLPTDD